MFCKQCGNQMLDSTKFCPACGAPAQSGAPQQVQMKRADEVELTIHGGDLQFVEIMLDPGEAVVAEAGAMMYMDSALQMDTIFGDGSGDAGGELMGKLVSAGKQWSGTPAPIADAKEKGRGYTLTRRNGRYGVRGAA